MIIRLLSFALLALSLCLIAPEAARAVEKVNSPNVTKGRAQVEYLSLGTWDDARDNLDDHYRHRWQVSGGLTERFDLAASFTSTYDGMHGSRASGLGLRGKYELTTQGDWWLASAVQARYTQRVDTAPNDLHVRGIVQRREGAFVGLLNLGVRRDFGPDRDPGIELRGAAQALYQINPGLAIGAELFTVLSPLHDADVDDQGLEIGPVISGRLLRDGDNTLTFITGYYVGLTDEAPDGNARLQLNYGWNF